MGTIPVAFGNIKHLVFPDLQCLLFGNDATLSVAHITNEMQTDALAVIPLIGLLEIVLVEMELIQEYCIIHNKYLIKNVEYYAVNRE